jgi:hypothetical protein
LNRQLNSYETDEEKERGVTLYKKIFKETNEESIKNVLQNYLTDYE